MTKDLASDFVRVVLLHLAPSCWVCKQKVPDDIKGVIVDRRRLKVFERPRVEGLKLAGLILFSSEERELLD